MVRNEGAAGASAPSGRLRRVWAWWKRTAHTIGNFQARLLLTLCYFVVVAPFALLVRSLSDPLAIKPSTPRGWRPRAVDGQSAMARALQQF